MNLDPQLYPDVGLHPLVFYAITIKPDNSNQFIGFKDFPLRLERFKQHFKKHIEKVNSIDYIIWTELSTPYDSLVKGHNHFPRLHNHGIIQIHNMHEFLIHDYIKLTKIGSVKLEPIRSLLSWYNYCTKQQRFIKTPKFYTTIDFVKGIKNIINYERRVTGCLHPPIKEAPAKG